MPHILVRHKVRDFASWKKVFDEHGATRKASGSKGGFVFRNGSDKNEVFVLLEWSDLDKAKRFVESQDLKAAMDRAGVLEKPDVWFLEEGSRPQV
jgi:heme-degrading monooxygenase HmoA